jgi:glycosyltransferase involved in cell wall biosynthesis
MRILFCRPNVVFPEQFAGTELTLHELCRSLLAAGHQVAIAATTFVTGAPPSVSREHGYLIVRAWNGFESVCRVLQEFQPDVLVTMQSGVWLRELPTPLLRTPLVVWEHEASVSLAEMPAGMKARAVYLANSPSTAAHLKEQLGVQAMIAPPLFGIENYVGIHRSGDAVLFVSLQRRKGADVAVGIARERPRVPFLFIESWTENPEQSRQFREEIACLPNAALLPNQSGLRHVMPKIKLHLMPSRSREGWGRTATEAQICGIPVLASSRGNLPVTVGPGGVTLDPDEPLERWLAAFDAIMNDASFYDDLSRKATAQGMRMVGEARRAYETVERALALALEKARS